MNAVVRNGRGLAGLQSCAAKGYGWFEQNSSVTNIYRANERVVTEKFEKT